MFGALSILLVCLLGMLLHHAHDHLNNNLHIYHNYKKVTFYEGTIASEVQTSPKYYKFILEVNAIYHSSWARSFGKILVYLPKSKTFKPTYGDKLLIKGQPTLIQEKRNPFDFDYRNFLCNQNIHLQHFTKENNFKYAGNNQPNVFYGKAIASRMYLNTLIYKFIKDSTSASITSALVLGIKGNLDDEIKNAYSSTGTMHVLAVSGMHVGIIYYILVLLFGWIRSLKRGNYLYFLLIFCSLWGYAFITGLSPSVLRAVTMFSIIVLADVFKKQTNIWNSIALSAFVLLLSNTNLLFDAGFQLSYLALIGIVYLQPYIYNQLVFNNQVLDEIWKIVTASIAAQFAVFPLCILYFNQFPNLFIFSNLLIVPLSTLILYLGLTALVLFHFPIIGPIVGNIIEFLVELMNKIALGFEKIPFAITSGISTSAIETFLCYLIIIQLILLFSTKKFKFAIRLTLIAVCWSIYSLVQIINQSNSTTLNIFNTPTRQIDLFTGLKAISINNNDQNVSLQNKLTAYRNLQKICSVQEINTCKQNNIFINTQGAIFMVIKSVKILIINKPVAKRLLEKAQVVIIGRNSFEKLGTDSNVFKDKIVILDSSNDKKLSKRYFYQCKKKGINIFSVYLNNALTLDLNQNINAIRKL